VNVFDPTETIAGWLGVAWTLKTDGSVRPVIVTATATASRAPGQYRLQAMDNQAKTIQTKPASAKFPD
jgi:hypothetical protein